VRAPIPIGERISLKHGTGGRAMRALIEQVFLPGAEEPVDGVGLAAMDDGAAIRVGDRWLVLKLGAGGWLRGGQIQMDQVNCPRGARATAAGTNAARREQLAGVNQDRS
jgi:hypothetical protein